MYTYDDYKKKKAEYGFDTGGVSDADDRLAQQNPDAGMSLLTYKNDFNTATSDSARAFAHANAEAVRKQYGNYTGGESGGGYAVLPQEDTYQNQYNELLNTYVKRMQGDYSYDPNTDPNTKYYTAAYRREGQRAAQDTMGAIAAATGGIPSSYAAAAAQQASNYYAQQLADKYPELYQQAYNNFLSEYSRASDTLSQLSALEQNDYNKYLYDQQFKRQDRQEQREITQQQLENAYYEAQQKFDVDYRLRQLDQNERAMVQDIAYKYAALEQSGKQADKELQYRYAALSQQQKALVDELAYKYAAMGQTDLQNQRELDYQLALIGAENGDFSGLRNLGIDTSKQEEYYNAVVQAELNSLREQELTDDDVFLTLYDGKLTNDEKRLWEEKIQKFKKEREKIYGKTES